jgi:hypothetical protein
VSRARLVRKAQTIVQAALEKLQALVLTGDEIPLGRYL